MRFPIKDFFIFVQCIFDWMILDVNTVFTNIA